MFSLQLFTGQKKQPVIVPMYAASLVSLSPPTSGNFCPCPPFSMQTSAEPDLQFEHQIPQPLIRLQFMQLAFLLGRCTTIARCHFRTLTSFDGSLGLPQAVWLVLYDIFKSSGHMAWQQLVKIAMRLLSMKNVITCLVNTMNLIQSHYHLLKKVNFVRSSWSYNCVIARCPLLAACGFDPLLSPSGDAGTHQRAREAHLRRRDDRFHRADAPGCLGAELLSLRHRPGRAAGRGRSTKVKK